MVTSTAPRSASWSLARALTFLWRRVPVRGPGRVVEHLMRRAERSGEHVIGAFGGRALVRLENPPEASLFLWGVYEPEVLAAIEATLGPGMNAVDVGANCGVLTLAMRAAVGQGGRVVAIDPSPKACARVREQAARNGFTNVEVIRAALGSRPGASTIYFAGKVGVGALPQVDRAMTIDDPVETPAE